MSHFQSYALNKQIAPDRLESFCESLRQKGKTIATLNGSFDLMHAGHLEIIYAASLEADILIVALNSDASIRQYKSPNRPIVPLEYRLRMMSALDFVDYVTWFEETDPRRLLQTIKPNIHVNGADWGSECIEAETVKALGAKLQIIPLVPGLSTSTLIEKIKSL